MTDYSHKSTKEMGLKCSWKTQNRGRSRSLKRGELKYPSWISHLFIFRGKWFQVRTTMMIVTLMKRTKVTIMNKQKTLRQTEIIRARKQQSLSFRRRLSRTR
jgi:hypothetical protein